MFTAFKNIDKHIVVLIVGAASHLEASHWYFACTLKQQKQKGIPLLYLGYVL